MPSCGTSTIPVFKAPDYCNPETFFGGYSEMLIGVQPLADGLLPELTARVDNVTPADPTKLRQLFITGDKPAGTTTATDISGRRKAYAPKEQTINFTSDDLNGVDRLGWKEIEEANGWVGLLWPATPEHRWGGLPGFSVTINVDEVIPGTLTDTHKIIGTAVFTGSMGDRTANLIP